MKKNNEEKILSAEPKGAKIAKKSVAKTDAEFSDSISVALKQKNEKGFLWGIVAIVAVVTLLVLSAVADLLTLCFQVNRILGYVASLVMGILVLVFVLRPIAKVLCARFFITDVTNIDVKKAKSRNRRAIKEVGKSLVEYHKNPQNVRFFYITPERVKALDTAVKQGHTDLVKARLKEVYATDVASCANGLILRSAGKVFLTTSISQNEKIDGLSALLINLSLVKQIVGIYGYRPSYAKLFRIYLTVLRSALIAYGMQNVNWFNMFSKFFSGVTKKIPLLDTVVDSAVQGTVSAFFTILIGYKTKKYLCSDYKKQESIDLVEEDGVDSVDEEVKIAASLAKRIRREKSVNTGEAEEK